MSNSKPLLYGHFSDKSFCHIHRILYPFIYTTNDLPNIDVDLSVTDPYTLNYRYFITHGLPPLSTIPTIGTWKAAGGKWILSLDDDYRNIPTWNPARLDQNKLGLFEFCLDAADYIISSTPALTKTLGLEHKTLTAPNLMDVNIYDISIPAQVTKDKLRILWSGSTTHKKDLDILQEPLDYLIPKYKDQVEFIFFGMVPDGCLKYLNKGVYYESEVPIGMYHKTIRNTRPHIVLAPLADVPFNHCKSNIRVLEGWCLCAPVVASPVGEYNVVQHECDGYLANNTKEWIEYLELLIANDVAREKMGLAGRYRVGEEFDWNNYNCREPWRKLLQQLDQMV